MTGRARRSRGPPCRDGADAPRSPTRALPRLPLLLLLPLLTAPGAGEPSPGGASAGVEAVVFPRPVLASMNERFRESNEHWDEAPARKRTARYRIGMAGAERTTPLEYMGCLRGEVAADTLRIVGAREARDLIQFQFGVDGSCEHVPDRVGTWHTHPFRVEVVGGEPVKERSLSPADLETFRESGDLVIVAVWDVDSLDAAARGPDGEIVHPVPVVVPEAPAGRGASGPRR